MLISRRERIRRVKKEVEKKLRDRQTKLTYEHWTDIYENYERLITELEEELKEKEDFWKVKK